MTRPALVPPREPERLIKSRDRVRDRGEVFTARREVNAMLDLVDTGDPRTSAFCDLDVRFLEPAAGHGNFLREILRRKLTLVSRTRRSPDRRFEFDTLRALASVYGIDICEENVVEARQRLRSLVVDHYASDGSIEACNVAFRAEFFAAVDEVLRTNIVCGDTLLGAGAIRLVEYNPQPSKLNFRRVVYPMTVIGLPRKEKEAHALRMTPVRYELLSSDPAPTSLRVVRP